MNIPPGIDRREFGELLKLGLQLEWDARARADLHAFVERGWRHAGLPGKFVDGWHIKLLCRRLQDISERGHGRLLWSSPPRSTKSIVVNVFWPAWTWLQPGDFSKLLGPWVQFLHVTHRDDLAVRDSQRCRQLVKSPWYQRLSEGKVEILPYADQSAYFGLNTAGLRRAYSIRAQLTGLDSDVQIVDDPYDVEGVLSQVEREHAEFVFDEILPSRFNHPTRNAQVLAAQRTHVADLHAHVMESMDYTVGRWQHDVIPGILEADELGKPKRVSDGDERINVGDVYWPERFTPESLKSLTKTAHAWAAQVQQDPQVRGAGVFRNAKWEFADDYPIGMHLCRYWDKAATPEGGAQDPDWTAGALGGRDRQGRFWLVDMQRGRWSSSQVEERIRLTARELDPSGTQLWIEEEPASAGKDVTSYYQRHVLPEIAVRGDRATGHPLIKVDSFLAATEAGNVTLLRAAWNRAFLDECDSFSGDKTTHDDQVIAAAGAFKKSAALMGGVFQQARLHGV